MASYDKDFVVKNGLVVQGIQAIVNGNPVLTTASSINALQDIDLTGVQNTNVLAYQDGVFVPVSDIGLQGAIGAQGVQGTIGNNGIQGFTGIQGTAGYIGADGTQGIQGITGNTGPTGSQGIQGTTGEQGIQGTEIGRAHV